MLAIKIPMSVTRRIQPPFRSYCTIFDLSYPNREYIENSFSFSRQPSRINPQETSSIRSSRRFHSSRICAMHSLQERLHERGCREGVLHGFVLTVRSGGRLTSWSTHNERML